MSLGKVLHLIDSAGLYGAERVILTLLEILKDSLYPGILGCIRERDDEIPFIAEAAQQLDIPVVFFTMRRGFNPFGIRQILKFIKTNHIRIVHSHGYKPNIFIGVVFARNFRAISTIHGWAKKTAGLRTSLYELFDVQALKKMDFLVAVSNRIAKDLADHGVKEDKIRIIYNGLKLSEICPYRDSLKTYGKCGKSIGIPVLGTLGRLAPVKGHDTLIKSMPLLLHEFGPCELVIAGSGSLKAELEKLINELQLENCVRLVGYVEDVWEFLSMVDVFVLPSLSEGLPMSLLEAMVCGKPIVASSVGGIPEVILSDEDGVLIPPGDPVAIAKAVTMLLRRPERMTRMGSAAREVVRNRFSAEVMAAEYLDLYSRLARDS